LSEVRAAFGLPTPAAGGDGGENPYDRLADGFEQHLDMELLWKILEGHDKLA
jgi:cobyric acid synthase